MIVVLTVPQRQEHGLALSLKLGAVLLTDTLAPGKPNPLRGLRSALAYVQAPLGGGTTLADWAAVFQDDAIVPDWLDALTLDQIYTSALEQVEQPAAAVALYYGGQSATGGRIRTALARGQRFARKEPGEYLATVGTIYPREWLDDWLDYSTGSRWAQDTHDDECWGAYLDANELPAVATVPCIVQHDNTLPSTSGENHGPRWAATPSPTRMPPWYT